MKITFVNHTIIKCSVLQIPLHSTHGLEVIEVSGRNKFIITLFLTNFLIITQTFNCLNTYTHTHTHTHQAHTHQAHSQWLSVAGAYHVGHTVTDTCSHLLPESFTQTQ